MNMQVLVTGAQGRVGRRLVATLLARGYTVRGMDVRAPAAPLAPGYQFVQGDLLDNQKVVQVVKGVDAVLHIAGLILFDDRQSRRIIDVNLRATFEVLEAMAWSGQKFHRFVYASSGQVYPDSHAPYDPVDEYCPTEPDTYYGYAKLASEEMAWFYQRKFGIPAVSLRFSHVQDPSELIDSKSEYSSTRFFVHPRLEALRRTNPMTPLAEQAIHALEAVAIPGEQLFMACSPEGVPYEMTIIHTQDLVDGIILAMEKPAAIGRAYNLGPAGPFNFGEMIPYMSERLGIPYARVNLPFRPYRYDTSIAKIRAELGYQPRYDARAMIDEAIANRK
jgi:UDP-glucose 4-epimerase